jgi:hypothetical protein
MSVIVTVLGLLSTLWLVYRVLINPPHSIQFGAVLGLIASAGILYGGFASMRAEGIAERDAPANIPVVHLHGQPDS